MDLLLNQLFLLNNLFSFKKYSIRIAKLYFVLFLFNIRNIDIKYSHCGPIHFNKCRSKTFCLHTFITFIEHYGDID